MKKLNQISANVSQVSAYIFSLAIYCLAEGGLYYIAITNEVCILSAYDG